MTEPFYIVGPTAVGKTEIAVAVAERCGAEIVSADAFQVYAGLERLTAKPSEEQLAAVRHHLVGHVPLSEAYSVARFRDEAAVCLAEIAARGKPALVVGGSGLYVKALTHGLSELPPAQPGLRAELEGVALPELVSRLQALDPVAATSIDLQNKRRVVRALEVCIITGGRISNLQTAWRVNLPPIKGVFLTRERDELNQRIERRTERLLDEAVLREVEEALRSPLSETSVRIIGLAEIASFLAGDLKSAECLERIGFATRRYAKRQVTWFRAQAFARVVRLSENDAADEVAAKIVGQMAVQASW